MVVDYEFSSHLFARKVMTIKANVTDFRFRGIGPTVLEYFMNSAFLCGDRVKP